MAGSDERTKSWVVLMTAVLGLVPLAVCITTAWRVMTSWRSRRGLTNPPPAAEGGETVDVFESTTHQNPRNPPPPAAGGGETVDVVESTTPSTHQTPINPPPPAAGGGETVDVVESTTPSTHQTPINPPPPAFGGVEEEDAGAMMERLQPPFYVRAVEETAAALSALRNLQPTEDTPYDEEEALKEFETPGTVRFAYKMLCNSWSAEPDEARAHILFENIKLFQASYPHLFLAGRPRHFPRASGGGSSAAIRGGTEEVESSSTSATTGTVDHGHDPDAE